MAVRMGIAGVTGRMGQLLVEEVTRRRRDTDGRHRPAGSTKPPPSGIGCYPTSPPLPPPRMW